MCSWLLRVADSKGALMPSDAGVNSPLGQKAIDYCIEIKTGEKRARQAKLPPDSFAKRPWRQSSCRAESPRIIKSCPGTAFPISGIKYFGDVSYILPLRIAQFRPGEGSELYAHWPV